MGQKKRFTEEELYQRRREKQEEYRKKVLRFTLQFNLKDKEAREWFEQQENKGEYLKKLILSDKERRLADKKVD